MRDVSIEDRSDVAGSRIDLVETPRAPPCPWSSDGTQILGLEGSQIVLVSGLGASDPANACPIVCARRPRVVNRMSKRS